MELLLLFFSLFVIDGTWCEDAKLVVQGLTYGQILQAQVYDYTPEGIPLILLYAVHGTQVRDFLRASCSSVEK